MPCPCSRMQPGWLRKRGVVGSRRVHSIFTNHHVPLGMPFAPRVSCEHPWPSGCECLWETLIRIWKIALKQGHPDICPSHEWIKGTKKSMSHYVNPSSITSSNNVDLLSITMNEGCDPLKETMPITHNVTAASLTAERQCRQGSDWYYCPNMITIIFGQWHHLGYPPNCLHFETSQQAEG